MMWFPTKHGMGEVRVDQPTALEHWLRTLFEGEQIKEILSINWEWLESQQ